MRADARGDPAIGGAMPAFGEGDSVAQAFLADLGMMGVVAAPELVQANVEDLVGDLGAQAAGLDRVSQPVRRIPDVVDGGDAGLEHVGAAGLGQQRPFLLRDVLLHAECDFEQRRLGGVVVGLAAEDQGRRVRMAVDEAGQHRPAGAIERASRCPMSLGLARAGMEDAPARDRDLAIGDDRHAGADRIKEFGAHQQVDCDHGAGSSISAGGRA